MSEPLTDDEREALWQASCDYWRGMPWWPADAEFEEGERDIFLGGEGRRIAVVVERIVAARRAKVAEEIAQNLTDYASKYGLAAYGRAWVTAEEAARIARAHKALDGAS